MYIILTDSLYFIDLVNLFSTFVPSFNLIIQNERSVCKQIKKAINRRSSAGQLMPAIITIMHRKYTAQTQIIGHTSKSVQAKNNELFVLWVPQIAWAFFLNSNKAAASTSAFSFFTQNFFNVCCTFLFFF